MTVRILDRTDTEANWAAANPVLRDGEIGFVFDTALNKVTKFKVGNGTDNWNTLSYFASASTGTGGAMTPLTVNVTGSVAAKAPVFLNTNGTIGGFQSNTTPSYSTGLAVYPGTAGTSGSVSYTVGCLNTKTGRYGLFEGPVGRFTPHNVNWGSMSIPALTSISVFDGAASPCIHPSTVYDTANDVYIVSRTAGGDGWVNLYVVSEASNGSLTTAALTPISGVSGGNVITQFKLLHDKVTGRTYIVICDTTGAIRVGLVTLVNQSATITNITLVTSTSPSAINNFAAEVDFNTGNVVIAYHTATTTIRAIGAKFDGTNWTVGTDVILSNAGTNPNVSFADNGTMVFGWLTGFTSGGLISGYNFRFANVNNGTVTLLGNTFSVISSSLYDLTGNRTGMSLNIDGTSRTISTVAWDGAASISKVFNFKYSADLLTMDNFATSTAVSLNTFSPAAPFKPYFVKYAYGDFTAICASASSGSGLDGTGSRRGTILPYRTMSGVTTFSQFLGIAKDAVTDGSATVYQSGQLVEGMSGLTAGAVYYLNANTGAIGTSGYLRIGRAVTPTSLLLD